MLFRRQVFITDRAVPLYSREESTERLTVRPFLFEPSSLTLTTSLTQRPIVSERVNKAWGFNVGCGPLWDLGMVQGSRYYGEQH